MSMAEPNVLRLHPSDDVVVAMRRLEAGEPLAGEQGVAATEPIAAGHKAASRPLTAGEAVRKYGQVIGAASASIAPGAHVHTHNLSISALRGTAAKSVWRP